MTTTEITKEVITHILKIKWEWVKYISKILAENIFKQLSDPNKKTIIITNANNFTYIQKYRNELVLIPLDKDNKDFEYLLYASWLPEHTKDRIREIWDLRKKEHKSLSDDVLKKIIEKYKWAG